jgi:hypothetical protein
MSEFGVRGQETSSEFFFRVTDRLQMESCLTALVQDSKSVVISSESNELIDHFGTAFVRRIRQKLNTTLIEVFLPRDTEAMLERFNQLLNTLSLDVATKSRIGRAPEKVWVVHDANAMGAHELQLLTRLIQQFPGAGVSVVLMFQTQPTSREDFANQHKQFVSWVLELPTAEQKLSAVQQARKNGQEEQALEFFNRLTKAAAKKTSATSSAKVASGVSAQSSPSAAKPRKTPTAKVWPWALGLSSMLLISLGVVAKLHPEMTDQVIHEVSALMDFQGASKKLTPPPEPQAKLEVAQDKPPGPPDANQVNNKDRLEPEIVLNPAPAAPPVQEVPPPKEVAVEKIITELPDVAVQGRAWLKTLPEDSFVLEHQSFTRLKDAQSYLKGKEWLVNARITPVYLEGQEDARFAVVTGHFKSKERAKNTIARLKLSSDVVVVPVPLALSQSQSQTQTQAKAQAPKSKP